MLQKAIWKGPAHPPGDVNIASTVSGTVVAGAESEQVEIRYWLVVAGVNVYQIPGQTGGPHALPKSEVALNMLTGSVK